MRALRHSVLPYLIAFGLLLGAVSLVAAENWPTAFDYTVGIGTDSSARYQVSGLFSGPIGPNMGLKIGGWWITGSDDNNAFVGDAYVDYDKAPVYVAVGRKYVPFGPLGVLVSPGIGGGEVRLNYERVTVQAIAGTLSFTPVTGGTRFTYSGYRVPSDENMTAGRVAVLLTDPGSDTPVTVGVNLLDVMDDTGSSVDLSVGLNKWLTVFGEAADYADVDAKVYGIYISDVKLDKGPKNLATILAFYYRDIPIGFVPASVGASAFFEGQDGWAGGLYQQLSARTAVGVYADRNDAILTWFQHIPL